MGDDNLSIDFEDFLSESMGDDGGAEWDALVAQAADLEAQVRAAELEARDDPTTARERMQQLAEETKGRRRPDAFARAQARTYYRAVFIFGSMREQRVVSDESWEGLRFKIANEMLKIAPADHMEIVVTKERRTESVMPEQRPAEPDLPRDPRDAVIRLRRDR